jgi:hypothetical protein
MVNALETTNQPEIAKHPTEIRQLHKKISGE